MGKKGKALREAKSQRVTYTFTKEELAARDRQLLKEHEENLRAKTAAAVEKEWSDREARFKEVIEAEWQKREDLFNSNDPDNNLIEFTRLAFMIPLRLLVEWFGWQPARPTKKGIPNGRFNITRLHDLCAITINEIARDELKDIRKYSDEAEKITGVDFRLREDGWK